MPNAARIIYEEIEGEVIIIHSQTGTYYNLLDTAVPIWQMIASGCTVDAMINAMASAYKMPAEQIHHEVLEFIRQLHDEAIIIEAPAQGTGHLPKLENVQAAYTPPQVRIYADLQDLLTIDPIHDVDESGWPNARITSNDDARTV
jgi:hypothetical protein